MNITLQMMNDTQLESFRADMESQFNAHVRKHACTSQCVKQKLLAKWMGLATIEQIRREAA